MKYGKRYVRTKARKIAAEQGRAAALRWWADKTESTGETRGSANEALDSGLLENWRETAIATPRDEYNSLRTTWAGKWHTIALDQARKHAESNQQWRAIAYRYVLPAINAEFSRWRGESQSTRAPAKVPKIDTICAYLKQQRLRRPR